MTLFLQKILRTDRRVFFALGFFILIAYSFMLNSPFKTLDDDFSIVNNEEIRSLQNIPEFFQSTYFKTAKDYYRPFIYVSYTLEYAAFKLNHFYYNLDNVLIHVLNAFFVFLLAGFLLRKREEAFWVALLFAIHPVHWEAVGNVAGRSILLCGLFVFVGFLGFLKYLRTKHVGWLVLSVCGYTLGLLCKESAGVLILTVGLAWLILGNKSLKDWREGARLALPFVLVASGYLVLRHQMGISKVFPWPDLRSLCFGILSFLKGMLTYLRIFVLPFGLHFDRSQEVFHSLLQPVAWMTLLAYGFILSVCFKLRRRFSRLTLLCVFWFLVELLPVSQIFTSIGVSPGKISLAEHFLYVASVPVFILMVRGWFGFYHWAIEKKATTPLTLKLISGAFVAFLFITLVQQNIYASNEMSMLERSLKVDPTNARLQYSIGMAYVKVKKFEAASKHFEKAVESHGCKVAYRVALGQSLVDGGDYFGAMQAYESIPAPAANDPLLRSNKEVLYKILIEEYSKKLEKEETPQIFFALGLFYSRLQDHVKALKYFEEALGSDPQYYEAMFNAAASAGLSGQRDKAIDYYQMFIDQAGEEHQLYASASAMLEQLQKGEL